MNKDQFVNFPVNMQLPQNYVDALIDMAEEYNMTAEQMARNAVAQFIQKMNPKGLTKRTDRV